MRIAVLADIHGNLPALEAVIADAQAHGVERFIVNGDVVNRGPQGVAAMARVAEIGAECTLGNHEDLLRRFAEEDSTLPAELRHDPFWDANRWCASALLAADAFATIARWPMTLRITLPGMPSVLIAHGSPRHFREGYGSCLDDATISEIVAMDPADVLVGSHTHRPLERRWGRVSVLNTGAVGTPFNDDGRAQYLWLTAVAGSWRVSFRRVHYDVREALDAYHALGYAEAGGLLARLFYDEVRDARSYLVPYQMWAMAAGEGLNAASFARFQQCHPAHFAAVNRWPTDTATVAP